MSTTIDFNPDVVAERKEAESGIPRHLPNREAILALRYDQIDVSRRLADLTRRTAGRPQTPEEQREADRLTKEFEGLTQALIRAGEEARTGEGITFGEVLAEALDFGYGDGSTYAIRSVEVRSQNKGSGPDGGYLVVPTGMLDDLHDAVPGHDGNVLPYVAQALTGGSATGNTVIPKVVGIPDVEEVEEAEAPSNLARVFFDAARATASKFITVSFISNELIEDSRPRVVDVITDAHKRAQLRNAEAQVLAAAVDDAAHVIDDAEAVDLTALQEAAGQVLTAGFTPSVVWVAPSDLAALRKSLGADAAHLDAAVGCPVRPTSAVEAGTVVAVDGFHVVYLRHPVTPVHVSRGTPTNTAFTQDMTGVRMVIRSSASLVEPDAAAVVKVAES